MTHTPPPPRNATERGLLAGGASDCAPGLSSELQAELQRWYDWVLAGAPDGEPFNREDGLCDNLKSSVRYELYSLFDWATFPFGQTDYSARVESQTNHECPKRLAWVRKMLAVQS